MFLQGWPSYQHCSAALKSCSRAGTFTLGRLVARHIRATVGSAQCPDVRCSLQLLERNTILLLADFLHSEALIVRLDRSEERKSCWYLEVFRGCAQAAVCPFDAVMICCDDVWARDIQTKCLSFGTPVGRSRKNSCHFRLWLIQPWTMLVSERARMSMIGSGTKPRACFDQVSSSLQFRSP